MNTNDNPIFSTSNETLSQEEIKRYVLGEMSEKEKHQVELLMESNPFLADAIAGYQTFPESIGTTDNNPYSSKPSKRTLAWSILGGLFLIGISFWYYNRQEIICEFPITEPITEFKNADNINKEELPIEVIESHYSDSSIQVTSKRPKSNEKAVVLKEKFAQVEKEIINNKIEPIALNPDKVIGSVKQKPKKKNLVTPKGFDIYHIVDYTVYDYRGKREEPIKILIPMTNGTPASQANKNSDIIDSNPTEKVFYDAYLKETIILFSKQNYKQAGKRFKTILKKYPNDVNALFYSSMCSFKRKKYKKSSLEFKKYLNQDITLFDEDANFFLALSLLEIGDNVEASLLLVDIVKQDGFYKSQAEELLKK